MVPERVINTFTEIDGPNNNLYQILVPPCKGRQTKNIS